MLTSTSFLLIIFLILTGWVLDRAYKSSVQTSIEERLQIQIYGLLTVANIVEGKLFLPEAMTEPRFNQLSSGLYGFVFNDQGKMIWRSASSLGLELPFNTQVSSGNHNFLNTQSQNSETFFYFSFGTRWDTSVSNEESFTFVVAENQLPYQNQVSEFQQILFTWFGGLALVLTIVQLLVMTWSIKPINALVDEIKAIEHGDAESLGDAPLQELQGITENINRLIENERRQRTRYKDRMANLAHSLKTPLAVLLGLSETNQSSENIKKTLDEQCRRMNQIVTYQLQRAVSSEHSLASKPVNAKRPVERIVDSLNKVYTDKNIHCTVDIEDSARFFGDESDLMEILGNIGDNAHKLCKTKVAITVSQSAANARQLRISIADDGAGITEDKREKILQRGVRADSLNPGQGIGLAVVSEIVAGYNGEITIQKSQLGGAEFIVVI